MSSKKRPYTKRKRAQSEEETRRKIVEAAISLHEEFGPRDTTIKAIADRAGVQRLTVYRHFETETAIFQACTAQWLDDHPLPGKEEWDDVEDGVERVRSALATLYCYYRATSAMWTVAFRDEPYVPALREPMEAVRRHLDELASDLETHLAPPAKARKECAATIRHAVEFSTWKSLSNNCRGDPEMAALAQSWVSGCLQINRTGSG